MRLRCLLAVGAVFLTCVACAASAATRAPGCSTVLHPGARVARAIARARPGAVVCLASGDYRSLSLRFVAPRSPRYVTVRSLQARGARISGVTLAGDHRLRFTLLRLTAPVRLGAHVSFVDFEAITVTRATDLRIRRGADPGGRVRAIRVAADSTRATESGTAAPTPTASRNCFVDPAACGFPDPGAGTAGADCGALPQLDPGSPPAGTRVAEGDLLEVVSPHTTLANLALPVGMSLEFAAGSEDSTLDDVCVRADGGGASGSTAVDIAPGVDGIRIEDSTLEGADATGESTERAITNDANNPEETATGDDLANCGECVHGTWTLDDSWVDANATIAGEHYEDWYFSDGTISADHDVLINPHEQTAEIFGDVGGGGGGPADNHVTLTDSLLAGGGYMIYTDSSASSVGSSTMDITGNRFARCESSPVYDATTGGTACSGGPDAHGIWPKGGYFGIASQIYCSGTGQTWSDNVWDDTSRTVGCSG